MPGETWWLSTIQSAPTFLGESSVERAGTSTCLLGGIYIYSLAGQRRGDNTEGACAKASLQPAHQRAVAPAQNPTSIYEPLTSQSITSSMSGDTRAVVVMHRPLSFSGTVTFPSISLSVPFAAHRRCPLGRISTLAASTTGFGISVTSQPESSKHGRGCQPTAPGYKHQLGLTRGSFC